MIQQFGHTCKYIFLHVARKPINRRPLIAAPHMHPGDFGTNQLLDSLQNTAIDPLISKFQFVAMPIGMVIYESGAPMQYVYFPTSSVVSLSHSTARGCTSQVALVGHEGLIGVSAFMGGNATSGAVVICSGMGYRIGREAILQAFNGDSQVQSLLLRYTLSLIAQVSQNAVCNRHHQMDQQLCSLLLLCSERFLSDTITLTHEQLADMLGVRREGVTHIAFQLQEAKVIRYARGHIKILDRKGLESRACECHALVKAECARLLPKDVKPGDPAYPAASRSQPGWDRRQPRPASVPDPQDQKKI